MGLLRRTALMFAAGAAAAAVVRGRRPPVLYDLRGRTVLVTGGSRGLGLVLARGLVREGARVAICGRDVETLERARVELERLGGEVLAVPCDVTAPAQVDDLVRIVHDWFGPLDVIVNNAGTIAVGAERATTIEDYEEALRINFWGAVHVIRAALPDLRRRPGSRIVNITSIGGLVAVPHLLPYTASKFALVGYSRGLRAELAADGVVVTTVCPGLMRTGSPPNAYFKGRPRAEYAWFSVGDSLPGLTVSAETACARILDACRLGRAEVAFPFWVRLAAAGQAVAPELTALALTTMHRLLPAYHGAPTHERLRGWDAQSMVSPSWLTTLGDRATLRNNQTAATR